MNHRSDLIRSFSERGYIHQATNIEGLDERAARRSFRPISASTARPTASMSGLLSRS